MVKICVCGVCGKIGMKIVTHTLGDSAVRIVSALERKGHPMIGRDLGTVMDISKKRLSGVKVSDDPAEAMAKADCVIDFTLPGPTMEHLSACLKAKKKMVIGTTGCTPQDERRIKNAAKKIAIVFSPNMAMGVNLLFDIVAKAARVLIPDFSVKIDETHHVHKKDSPSGTAKMLAKVIKNASGKVVPIEAFRKGEVVGNHGVIYQSAFETIEIRHDAKSRDVFAHGAIKAAKFLSDKRTGLFDMADVLGMGKK